VDSLVMPASENLHNSGHKPSLSQSALCANGGNRGRGLLDQIAGAAR